MPTLTDKTRILNLRNHYTSHNNGKIKGLLPKLILMTDEIRCPDPLQAALKMQQGSAIILRHYDTPNRAALAQNLLKICKLRGIKLLIAGDPKLALKIGANGFHMPEYLVAKRQFLWHNWRPPGWIVTASAHSPMALIHANGSGADAVLLSPIYSTGSYSSTQPIGLIRFLLWCKKNSLPVYALGGICAENAATLIANKCAGFAAIKGFIEHA